MYSLMGRAHAAVLSTAAGRRGARRADLHDARGQGTVEYVALILLVASSETS